MIQYQILQTNITRTVWQTVRRITNEILGVKGLILYCSLATEILEALMVSLFTTNLLLNVVKLLIIPITSQLAASMNAFFYQLAALS